jgi:hypothetical protein
MRLIVVGEKPKDENRIHYPLDEDLERTLKDRWIDPPKRTFGPHDGHARAGTKKT